ncbi:hypothetical protein OZ410_07980 [Robiginitalea sp. M366]|uniref:hypothetical protein n=1 Tax=Robiginitalea aestuariiviva TaxID=3036903 RepID=UPI00240D8D71|nr:hypothetical protein [Robiginitalea aestuariiviva]MDG1572250.1 hypothetical protein [Robiginitalea aestuariiviva]
MQTYIGTNPIQDEPLKISGEMVDLLGDRYYRISHVDRMRPFFMSLVSDANHWMFISSNGGLTAGRKNSEYALFPYYTDDKITEAAGTTGCKTIFRVTDGEQQRLWEPLSERYAGVYRIRRNLYKNQLGNALVFEEENLDLGLCFRYQWQTSNQYGFVRKAFLLNRSGKAARVAVLDGFLNLLPYGVTTDLQQTRSNLVDAYKRSEMRPESGLGIYALSAIIVDRAEPSEALRANVVWSHGLPNPVHVLDGGQVEAFRLGHPVTGQAEHKGEKGAYLLASHLELEPGQEQSWTLVANVNQGPAAVANLDLALAKPESLLEEVEADIREGTRRLQGLAAAADGMQLTRDELRGTRHFANVMYNIMRGGIMDHNYQLERSDFTAYVQRASRAVYERQREALAQWPETFTIFDLTRRAAQAADPALQRLCYEYLPLKFSRRHGDPSRPWNKFSINTQRESDGAKILDYQGNWRDIFQNWEALAHSYPEFMDGMICKFLNASTADGYNPYRITKHGVDWEVIEPDDPWSYIGYWGDHQVIYLLKFLEFSRDYFPGRLGGYWSRDLFVYVDVPYRIKPFDDILNNPKDTIDFDAAQDKVLRRRMGEMGSDGVLLQDANGAPYRVNLLEKLLAMLLAKVSNFIPEAGIWLNTQRPEWNDANNALVGNGVSMVTLYYLHRFLEYFREMLESDAPGEAPVSEELVNLLDTVEAALAAEEEGLAGPFGDVRRRTLAEALGRASASYREGLYAKGFSGRKKPVGADRLLAFTRLMLRYTAHSIEANRREDHLFHAYNLIDLDRPDAIGVSYLSPMLEGQVAVLSSGFLDAKAALRLLDALRQSPLYRADQNSYILYPDRDLPPFMEKNLVPQAAVEGSQLVQRLLADGNRQVVVQDRAGQVHFSGDFNNASRLAEALDALPEAYQGLVARERKALLAAYEAVFNHRSFTGRSGTFFGYEGLGSIYWHMVSKLALAVLECAAQAEDGGGEPGDVRRLVAHYHQINDGIGVHKSPEVYGAFPTDPYSHTPAHRGAQQPGMTGQVKEDVLTRRIELGVGVTGGVLSFGPFWLDEAEFLEQPGQFSYLDVKGTLQSLKVPAGGLAFTCCQVPVVYRRHEAAGVAVEFADGETRTFSGHRLDEDVSREIFHRTGAVRALTVGLGL